MATTPCASFSCDLVIAMGWTIQELENRPHFIYVRISTTTCRPSELQWYSTFQGLWAVSVADVPHEAGGDGDPARTEG